MFAKESPFCNLLIVKMVGTGRFELPTPRTPSECSTRLSHVPTSEGRVPFVLARGGRFILHQRQRGVIRLPSSVGAEALNLCPAWTAPLKPCPDTNPSRKVHRGNFTGRSRMANQKPEIRNLFLLRRVLLGRLGAFAEEIIFH